MKRLLPIVALSMVLAAAPRARADDRDIHVWIGKNPLYDVGFFALSATGWYVGTSVLKPAHRDRPPLDGLGHRARVNTLGRAADVAVVLGLATGATLSFAGEIGSEGRGSGAQMFRGPVVTLEGALAGAMFTQLVKNIFGVCRPRDWDEATRKCTTKGEGGDDEGAIDEAHRSFPSGHSAPLAGMAGAAMGLYLLPSTPRREQLAVALTSLGFALTVVALRERAGAHSWVDVGAAFITGGLAGFLTAALHIRPVDKEATSTASAPMVFTLGTPF
jgi:membrane-associated phospholipid phosphatase